MSFEIMFYTPSWRLWQYRWDAWFFRPDKFSTGGVGFRVPFLHVCFKWGYRAHDGHRGSRA